MKKAFIYLAMCGLALAGCTNEDVNSTAIDGKDGIGFDMSTSRATVNVKDNVVTDGFVAYASSKASSSDWYIPGGIYTNYTWSPKVYTWPKNGEPASTDVYYPMHFYGYYPTTHDSYGTIATEIDAISIPITIQATAGEQADLLAFSKLYVKTKPLGDRVVATFNHITSKVNVGFYLGEGIQAIVQQTMIKDIGHKGTYNFEKPGTDEANKVAATWILPAEADDLKAAYNYYNKSSVSNIKPTVTLGATTSSTAGKFYLYSTTTTPTAVEAHLMLRPQPGIATWPKTKEETPIGARIELVYRLNAAESKIGYDGRADCKTDVDPKFAGQADYDKYRIEATDPYTGPLFVHVGFPLTASQPATAAGATQTLTWQAGKGYFYYINLGTWDASNGYVIHPYYLDEDGNSTGIPIDGDKEIGDPISGGQIDYTIEVNNWDDAEYWLPGEDSPIKYPGEDTP